MKRSSCDQLNEIVILDNCCLHRKLKDYIKKYVKSVIEIKDGRSDDMIVHQAERDSAYIVTSDNDFKAYPYERILFLKNGSIEDVDKAYNELENLILEKSYGIKIDKSKKGKSCLNNKFRNKKRVR